MPRAPRKKLKTGCPIKPIDWDLVDQLLIAGCNAVETAARLGIHSDTLTERCITEKGTPFSLYKQQKMAKGDTLLRQVRFKKAMGGDNTMLIWLSKTRLGEIETHKQIVQTQENAPAAVKLIPKKQIAVPDDENSIPNNTN